MVCLICLPNAQGPQGNAFKNNLLTDYFSTLVYQTSISMKTNTDKPHTAETLQKASYWLTTTAANQYVSPVEF